MLLLPACWRETPLNVFLITLDTTRADHLGCYGHQGIETPHIDRLAASGTRYENAFSPAPITLPAHTSMLTGTYPVHHGVRDNSGFYVPQEALTLAEVLRGAGYTTAAFVGAFPLDSQTGIDQGFDLYDDNYPSSLESGKHPLLRHFFDERPAAEVSRAALAWLEERQQRAPRPFFLWTHYFDPHQPFQPPSPYRERYASMPYDGEIASVDEAVGQILSWLEEHQLLDNTLVILTADHGEGLGEHDELTHALLLYSSTLHVPLIVREPGSSGGTTVSATVTSVDIFPTVLDRLGLEVPEGCQGLALPRSDEEAPAAREIYSETQAGRLIYGWSPLERLTTDSTVLIRGPSQRLYDRRADPKEEKDLGPARPTQLAALGERLSQRKAVLARNGQRFSRGETSAKALQEARARLAGLGYLGGGASITPSSESSDDIDPTRPDPQAMMEVFSLHNEGRTLSDIGRFELATAVLERAEKLDPDNPAVLQALAQAHLGRGAIEHGHHILEKLLGVQPGNIATLLLLARSYQIRNNPDEAANLLQAAVELHPSDVSTRLLLAHTLEDAARVAEAEAAYRGILDRESDHILAANGLATLVYRRGDTAQAVELLEALRQRQPFYAPAWLNLGVIELDRGHHQRSLQFAERALELRPGYPQALQLKAKSLAETSP